MMGGCTGCMYSTFLFCLEGGDVRGLSNDPSDLLSPNVRLTHLEGDTFYKLDLKRSLRKIGI